MVNQDTKRKIVIYGTNFFIPSLVNILKSGVPNIGGKIPGLDKLAGSANPYGAAFYGTLDIAGKLIPSLEANRFTRLSRLAGSVYYGASTALDLFSIAGGDYGTLPNIAFDASMAYQLITDTVNSYKDRKLKSDFSFKKAGIPKKKRE